MYAFRLGWSFDSWKADILTSATMNLNFLAKGSLIYNVLCRQTLRWGHTLRGKRPGVARTLAERLQGDFLLTIQIDTTITAKSCFDFRRTSSR